MINWNKIDWKLLRDIMWSGLAAYVLLVFLKVVTPPEPIAFLMAWATFIALTVALFNLVFRRKT